MIEASHNSAKTAAGQVLQALPEQATWEEIQYGFFVRQQIEAGLVDSEAHRVMDSEQLRAVLAERKSKVSTSS